MASLYAVGRVRSPFKHLLKYVMLGRNLAYQRIGLMAYDMRVE